MITRGQVEALAHREFPDEDVLPQLDRYTGPERERVQAAILKLAHRDAGELRRWVEVASTDYRDAIAWAEYPGAMTAGAGSGVVPGDAEQYAEWLRPAG